MDANWIEGYGEKGLVSVIIPTYNRADLLQIAVDSIIDQSYRPIECIVVDDGSTDSTAEVMRKYEEYSSGPLIVKYIVQKNAGSQIARNTGTKASTGELIQYLDSDDLLYPEKLEKQVAYLNQNSACDGVFGDWRIGTSERNEVSKASVSDNLIAQMLTGGCIHTLSFLMRRAIVLKAGGWDPAIKRNQEIDFHVRAILAGGKFEYLPHETGLWYIHSGERISNSTGLNDIVFFYQKMEHLLNKHQLFSDDVKVKISSFYMWLIAENIGEKNSKLITMLKEAIRLDPAIEFYNNIKMRCLRKIIGSNRALDIWLSWFRIVNKETNS